jgi:uncharacterized pyridoxamine 5'-phosphate oxidase family protein
MKEVVEFLKANPVGALATVEGGKARVRPFQFMYEDGGALWFCTSTKKKVYAQLKASPQVEFLASSGTTWLRVAGEVAFSDELAKKERVIASSELVRSIYKEAANPVFAVFKIERGTAVLSDFSGKEPRTWSF